jgi:4a-hydroxytetrahydrobiopterin dehydratase
VARPEDRIPTSADASAAVEGIGWRYLLGTLRLSVAVRSLRQASEVASAVASLQGADGHFRIDLRPDRVELSLQTRERAALTDADVRLAHVVSSKLEELGVSASGPTSGDGPRPVQMLEVGIDAMDISSIRPFWKAVLAYTDEPGRDGTEDAIVDPTGQLPAIWFQQMDTPRPQRNRVHLDITVAHDEALRRMDAALKAGGTLLDDSHARSFWVLADAEGNEVCICTWMDRGA